MSRRGPKAAPPETHFKRWNVTLPPEVDAALYLLLDSTENKSELITRLLESHPLVMEMQRFIERSRSQHG